ncbi:MAG TPA: lysophospholipid acyltransferase family protein [Candidatus Micrarchaeia archaeon]|nr:lysophospholipid acyltransferase family protein [Candidatus Micrarchaeia archaeon]
MSPGADPGPADASRSRPPAWLRTGFLLAAAAVRALGPSRYRLADALGNAAFACQPVRRRTTAANFQRALGPIGRRRARRLAAASYRAYARTAVDFLHVQTLSRGEVAALARVVGLAHLERTDALGRGGILVLVHHGSWDVAGAAALAHGFPSRSVMDEGTSRRLTQLVVWTRSRIGLTVVTPERGAGALLRSLRQGGWVSLLSDIPKETPAVTVPFLGRPSRFSAAPGLLAARTGSPIHAVTCERARDGHYVIEIQPPVVLRREDDPAAAIRPLVPVFEAAVRRAPEQWFPFDRDRFVDPAADGDGHGG